MSSSASSQVTRSHSPVPALAGAPQRVEDAIGVVELVDGRRALGAVAPAAARVHRVAFDLADRQVVLVDVGEEAAGRLAVEADGRDQHELALDLARVGLGVVRDEAVPRLRRREVAQGLVASGRREGRGRRRGSVMTLMTGHLLPGPDEAELVAEERQLARGARRPRAARPLATPADRGQHERRPCRAHRAGPVEPARTGRGG